MHACQPTYLHVSLHFTFNVDHWQGAVTSLI
jgi:hypothetical protein